MALIYKKENEWIVRHGKHIGQTLKEVAEEDPSYLRWVYAKASDDFTKEAFYALEDVMEEFDIDIP